MLFPSFCIDEKASFGMQILTDPAWSAKRALQRWRHARFARMNGAEPVGQLPFADTGEGGSFLVHARVQGAGRRSAFWGLST